MICAPSPKKCTPVSCATSSPTAVATCTKVSDPEISASSTLPGSGTSPGRARTRSAPARTPMVSAPASCCDACGGSGTLNAGPPCSCTPSDAALPASRFIGGSLNARATRIERGAMEHLGRRPVLQQLAGVEHGGVAAQQQRLGGLGGGVDHRGIAGREQRRELLAQLLAQLVVQVDQRLVEQHQRRVFGQRARQRHALLLAARQLGRQALQEGLDVQLGGQRLHALRARCRDRRRRAA